MQLKFGMLRCFALAKLLAWFGDLAPNLSWLWKDFKFVLVLFYSSMTEARLNFDGLFTTYSREVPWAVLPFPPGSREGTLLILCRNLL